MKRQVSDSLLLLLLALFLAVSDAEGCQNAPTWLFALPEDLEPIFAGLEGGSLSCICTPCYMRVFACARVAKTHKVMGIVVDMPS